MRRMVRALDVASGELLDRVYELMAVCHAEAHPEAPMRTRAEVEAFLRHPAQSDTRESWIAESDGDCIGYALLAAASGSPTAQVELLVHPHSRRAGRGAALLETVRSRATALGAGVLIGGHSTEAGSRFAAAMGATDKHREVESLLRLPLPVTVDPVPGYRLRSWVGAAPAELLDSFARAREAINDAPSAADEELLVWDAERVRALEESLERRNRDVRVTVALDEAGEVVAFTELRLARTPGATAGTEATAVLREHRRKGLGRLVKRESLRRLQQDRPDVTQLTTVNAEENRAMRALNEALGFRPIAVWTTCVLET